MTLIFDLETNGLLPDLTKIHCLVIYDTETQQVLNCKNLKNNITDGKYLAIETGISMLQDADEIAGHNIVKFDIPAIQKLYPSFKPKGKIFDTLLVSKLAYPDIGEIDDRYIRKGKYPVKIRGKYSLKAWGYRLGELKGTYNEQEDCWAEWTSDMQRYCEQDVMVTKKLFDLLKSEDISNEAVELEQQFAKLIARQERYGFCFDKQKAIDFAAYLTEEKARLEPQLSKYFDDEIKEEVFVPKRNNKTKSYIAGKPVIKRKVIPFNLNSNAMLIRSLVKRYGWKPTSFTDKGNPKLDDAAIEKMTYPFAPLLKDYNKIKKILGYVESGDKAWLKVEKNGIVYGEMDTLGAVTRRCTHRIIANVPAVEKDKNGKVLEGLEGGFGKECRELFIARKGFMLVGCDASGLELRCLAHYMKDDDYIHEILNGDIHTKNQKAAGLHTRADAKTFIYGFLYGAGNEKIGSIIGGGKKEGKAIKQKFLKSLPKLNHLIISIKKKVRKTGILKALDGSILKVRRGYSAPNTLLQSAGIICMKKAYCILEDMLQEKGWVFGRDYAFLIHYHDEYQAEVKPELVEEYKVMAVEAIRKAGEYFKLRCPLDGEVKVGNNWAETH
jgi:DNA polymerase I-like protein with 3'-5' exonuclease and polymerase domains